ncbi:hypothetical protein N480_08855 [Pseudoalteromonas luteoviolacea S2607]|nr:hypothetical protein N480_08855 [Pseudoalteromonas luteoviolacea S2607]
MYDIHSIFDHIFPLVVSFSLLLSWKIATARWFTFCYLTFIVVNLAMFQITVNWNTHFYIFEAFMAIVFTFPIIYRRNLALLIYNKTNISFYLEIYKKQRLTVQECTIILLVGISVFVNLITWIEVLAYKYYWIDNAYIKLYVRDNTILLTKLVLCGCFLTYAKQANSRELNYEITEN